MKKKIENRLETIKNEIYAIEQVHQKNYFLRVDWKILNAKRELLTELLETL